MAPPSRQSSMLRILVTVLLCTISVSALPQPHQAQHLDARDVVVQHADVPTTLVSKPDPKNFFTDLRDFLDQYDGGDILRNLFASWFKHHGHASTTTYTIVPTPIKATKSRSRDGNSARTEVVKTVFVTVFPTPTRSRTRTRGGVAVSGTLSSTTTTTKGVFSVKSATSLSPPSITGLPEFTLLPQTSSVGQTVSASVNGTTTKRAATSTESEMIFSILPIFPIPTPNLVNETATATANGTATLLPTPADFSTIPMFPEPTPDLGNETSTANETAAPLPTSAGFSTVPIFPPAGTYGGWNKTTTGLAPTAGSGSLGSGTVISGPVITTWPGTSLWPNITSSGLLGSHATGLPLVTGTPDEQNTTVVVHSKSTTTVYVTLPYVFPNATVVVGPTGTGIPAGDNATTSRRRTRTVVYMTRTRTVRPIPVTGTAVSASNTPPAVTETPRYLNGTTTTLSSSSSSSSSLPSTTGLSIPFPFPPTLNSSFSSLASLRRLCQAPNAHNAPLSLPLLESFYGPSAYPVLSPFPGCEAPNPSQQFRAPGLLNCTALGAEIQNCQKLGRRVILSVKGSGVEDVGGNLEYGTPGSEENPFGEYFGNDRPNTANGSSGESPVPVRGRPSSTPRKPHPNLFDSTHPPTSLALTLSSLFGETRTERADLRPLGPDIVPAWTPSDGLSHGAATDPGIAWVTRPLGEEVVVDGFDVQIPGEWEGTAQGGLFEKFVQRLRELEDSSWVESGGRKGGKGDLGSDGKGVVVSGWV